MSLQPSGLDWGNFVGSEAQQVSQTFGAHKNNSILHGRGVVSCTGSEGLVDDGSSEPHAVYLLAVTLPSPALYCFLRASLCHVTKKYSI